jgi:hypothetical protein
MTTYDHEKFIHALATALQGADETTLNHMITRANELLASACQATTRTQKETSIATTSHKNS